MEPSIGRIVIWNHLGETGNKSPAIIQNVAEDGTLRLFVFGSRNWFIVETRDQGDGPAMWNWPVRV